MRSLTVFLAVVTLCNGALSGQQSAPQSARQALIEMFFSKTPGTFVKHMPVATRAALEKSGALASLQQYSVLAGQFESQGKSLQTFETGSVLLATEDPKTGEKSEMTVENDSLRGDQDDLEVSFVMYKNGQAQRTPFMPHVTFSMKTESGVWKLYEIVVTEHIPLADPDFLKAIGEAMKASAAASTQAQAAAQTATQSQTPTQTFGSDASVIAAARTIVTAEATYASTYRSVGYTCTLSDLDGFGGGERNEHQAMLITSGLASGKKYGYTFTLSECAGTPATSFRLIAAPSGNSYGRRAFCADQSGAIRYSADGVGATCVSGGMPLP
jgi:hypothetical protein